uniref:Protein regulator of cytokinesis 1 n=1 Tax=Trichuris muris TaxID=70415 RepID=A0A5S6QW26_TRIMR
MDKASKLPTESLVERTNDAVQELVGIWQRLGISEVDCRARVEKTIDHVTSMLSEMVAEERRNFESVLSDVRNYKAEVQTVQEELNWWIVDLDNDLPLAKAASSYKLALTELKAEKMRRLALLKDLNEELAELCHRLGLEYQQEQRHEAVPTLSELDDLSEDVNFKKNILKQRISVFEGYASQMRAFASDLHFTGRDSFEVSVLRKDKAPTVLGDHDMDLLSALYSELSERHAEFVEQSRKECKAKLDALTEAWDRCKISANERGRFLETVDDDDPLEAQKLYEREIERLDRYYERRRAVLQLVEQWEENWEAKLDLESREADPSRYFNRGGLLLKEEKEKRAIGRRLGKLRQSIENELDDWSRHHPGETILIDDVPVMESLERKESCYAQVKEEEKKARQLLKKALQENEEQYGSSSNRANRQFKTPCKSRPGSRTPVSAFRTPTNPRRPVPQLVIRSPSCSCLPESATMVNLPPILPPSASLETLGTQPSSYGQFVVDLRSLSGNQMSSFISASSSPDLP